MKEIQYSVNLSKSSKSQVRSVQTTIIITIIIIIITIIIITIIIIISHACTAGFGSDTPVEGEQYAHRAHQDDAEDTLQIQR